MGRQTIPPDSLLPRPLPSIQQQRITTPSDDLGPPPGIPATYFPSSPSVAPSSTMILPNGLPPLPSYTEACTPTTPVLTVSSGVFLLFSFVSMLLIMFCFILLTSLLTHTV